MPATAEIRTFPSPIFLAVTVLVFALTFLFSRLSLYQVHPELAIGITYDLAFAAPIFYFLAIRKTRIPKTTVALVAGLGILTATYLLPLNQRTHLDFIIRWILPFGEIGLLGFAGYKTWKAASSYRRKRKENADVNLILNSVFDELLGRSFLSRAAAFEASILYYAFLKWRAPASNENSYSYHKRRGMGAIYAVIGFLIIVETVVFHVLISRWSVIAAWILTISSLYVLMLLLAQFKGSYLRPMRISRGVLKIRSGLFCDADIALDEIEDVAEAPHSSSLHKEICQAAFLKGFEPVNVLITTSAESVADGPYGFKTTFRKIAFFADEHEELIDLLKNHER